MTKTILITGCSSGIGYDAAHGLQKAGWTVFATCRNPADCARLQGEGLISFVLDMADPASIETGFNEALSRANGRLDALYNNAAFACPGAVEDLPTEALRAVLETNLIGLHDLTRRAIAHMRGQGTNGAGHILQCSSVLGIVPAPWRGAYVASKYALEGLTDVLRVEMRDTGIHIVLIEPGPITSKIRANSVPPFERWINWQASPRRAQYENSLIKRLYAPKNGLDPFELPASAVTKQILRALHSPTPKPRYYVTTLTHLMGAARRILPSRALDWLCAKG
ncbi:hypothetical protein BFP70_12410 [Thioclava sp. SK-1]|uniref:SDR family NAD(P)-dependent oxidoreductase n=1 Tax=Thioclava sp. SK-1 TaxID=1889770 RepID=UPI00082413D0|nr:SDR family NAD(P)-dependent oxidoreductase [Thioclava sp. SK-1]OCX63446.1 hypothetical protein BFP70_12410 [Thioclava sp. SK-1]